jgi:hypothetical protein
MSLRNVVKKASKQDVYVCNACNECDIPTSGDMDIPLSSLVQLVILNDDEALQCRTLWSDFALGAARGACKRGLNLRAMMIALREESTRTAENKPTERGRK